MPSPKKAARDRPTAPTDDGVSANQAPTASRRDKRREGSREEIVEAARRVLVTKGIAATTLDAVAIELGLTKAALYYYYPSKEALFFDVMFGAISSQANAVHSAVDSSKDGGEALAALIRETVKTFAPRLDDFRLAFLQTQLVKSGAVRFTPEQYAKLRPLNDRLFEGATERIAGDCAEGTTSRIEPRLLVFLAHASALGILTMKGLVESLGDPVPYSDEQLADGLASIFEAAAER